MSAKESGATRRRKLFDQHLAGFVLGETELDEVREKAGEPARVLEEERVVVLEYDDPREQSIARWKKLQFIFFDDLLMNVTYSEPEGGLGRAALLKVLGQPDESGEDEDEGGGEDGEGPSDIFEVDLDEDPMLSFVAHYLPDEKVEALSLCADMDDEDGEASDDGEGSEDDLGDESGDDLDDEASEDDAGDEDEESSPGEGA